MSIQKPPPRISLAPAQIANLRLLRIRLALKRNIVIGLRRVAVLNQPYHPFHKIPNIEEHPQQLHLLTAVNQLMVDVTAIQAPTFSDNDETEKVDGDVGAERNETAAEDAAHDIVFLVSVCEISKNITITQLF